MTRTPQAKTSLSLREFHALFSDERTARAWFEAARWPDGPVCPRCGATDRASWISTRARWGCGGCGLQYSVMSYTPMHRSHIPLLVWAQAIYLMVTSSKGISSLKLSEVLGLSYRSAWFLAHRIRAMMAADLEAGSPLLQGLVEIDETYAGARPRQVAHTKATSTPAGDDDDPPPPGRRRPKAPRKTGRGTSRPGVCAH